MDRSIHYLRNSRVPLCLVLAILLAVVLFVNPFRETAMDDDWAYALTVRHLLETGDFQLSSWAAANMIFQAYWGALSGRLLGYSFSSLRTSTPFLACAALISFYFLAKEHGLDDLQAGLLALGLFAGPQALLLSFTFMTDIPFSACLIIAQHIYTRAIRLHSVPLLLGGAAASAAILTRQFGVALLGALLLLWVTSKARKRQALLFLAGLAGPLVGGLCPLSARIVQPKWGGQHVARLQSQYLSNPAQLLMNVMLRFVSTFQYLALFALPFVFLAQVAAVLHAFSTLAERRRRLLLVALLLVGLALSTLTVLADWVGIGPSALGPEQTLTLIAGISLSITGWWLLRSSQVRRGCV